MDRRTCIIKALQNCPETWTDKQLADAAALFAIELSRHDLINAQKREKSIICNAIQEAIEKTINSLYDSTFEERINILQREILPALNLLEEIKNYYS